METKIIPAILAKNFTDFKEKVCLTENDFDLLQIDAMDGNFVNNQTFYDIDQIQELETRAKFELHLMVDSPLEIISSLTTKKISRVIFHLEPVKDKIQKVITEIKTRGMSVGLALNPETPLKEVAPYFNQIELVLLMTVNPGWAGQGFLESSYVKIKELRSLNQKIEIEIDGGASLENIPQLIESGVNSIAVGSLLFNSKDILGTIVSLKQLIK